MKESWQEKDEAMPKMPTLTVKSHGQSIIGGWTQGSYLYRGGQKEVSEIMPGLMSFSYHLFFRVSYSNFSSAESHNFLFDIESVANL